jgi:hypothetical protein
MKQANVMLMNVNADVAATLFTWTRTPSTLLPSEQHHQLDFS